MTQQRNFQFGGLNVPIYLHPVHGWGTSSDILAEATDVSERSVRRFAKQYGLAEDGQVVREKDLRTNLSANSLPKKGREAEIFWTVKGMIFVATLIRTPRALAFRKEVLSAIEELDKRGYKDTENFASRIDALEKSVAQLSESHSKISTALLRALEENEALRRQLAAIVDADRLEASAAGKQLAAKKKTKSLREQIH